MGLLQPPPAIAPQPAVIEAVGCSVGIPKRPPEFLREVEMPPCLFVVLRTALPAALTGPATPVPQPKTRRRATIAKELPTLIEREQTFARAKKQRELYELIESLGGSAPVELLTERMSFSASVLGGLAERGFIAIADEVVARDPFATRAVPPLVAHRATPQQQAFRPGPT